MRLFFMRHAEAEHNIAKKDIERALTNKGKDQATQASNFLKQYKLTKILASCATRTAETANIIKQHNPNVNMQLEEILYKDDVDSIIDLIIHQEAENRPFRQLASGREFIGDSEHKTGMHIEVHEDPRTEPAHKLSAEVEFPKGSNEGLLILSHNPIIHILALYFAATNQSRYDYLLQSSMPEARIIVLDFSQISSYSELATARGIILEIFTPS